MNESDNYQDDMVKTPEKKSGFFFYILMSLILIGLFGAAYYIIFQPDLSFLGLGGNKQEIHVRNSRVPQNNQTQTLQGNNNQNQTIQSNTGSVNIAPLISNNRPLSQKSPNQTENSQPTEPLQEQVEQNLPISNAEDSDKILEASENMPSSPLSQSDLPTSNMEETEEINNFEPEETIIIAEGDEFELTPPEFENENNLPSEEEFEIIAQNNQTSLLQQLQEAKNSSAGNTNVAGLPDKKFTLSDETGSSSQDIHITNTFIKELAKLAVDKYSPTTIEQRNALTATEAARYFGITMRGLDHPNGRLGIFSYAYNPRLIEVLTKNLAPMLIVEMENAAHEKIMTEEQTHFMFQYYAEEARVTAGQLEAIINSENVNINLEEYLKTENSLLQYQRDFASTQLKFSELSRKKEDTEDLEIQMKDFAKKASQAQQELVSLRNIIVANIAKNAAATTPKKSLLDLALWIKRRDNEEATKSAIQALYYVASLLSKK